MGLEEKMIMLNHFNIMSIRNKKPVTSWKHLIDRKQTPNERTRILRSNGNGEGKIGVVCGPVSGIFVLDDDGSNVLETYSLPRTVTVDTPRGGKHYYFRWVSALDDKITTLTGVLEKVDTRGYGGYVAWYGWRNPPNLFPLVNPPQWLIDKLPNKESDRKSTKEIESTSGSINKSWVANKLSGLKQGVYNWNTTFTSVAGSLRSRGYEPDDIFELLRGRATELGFPLSDLQTVCASVGRYKPGTTVQSTDEEVVLTTKVLSEKLTTEWFVDPQLISKQSITFLAGLPETCKTWMLMDLSLALATGTKWLGLYPCKKARVIYLDQERSRAVTIERFNALIKGRGLKPEQLDETLLIKPQSRFKFNLGQSFASFDRLLTVFKPGVVLIDSFKKIHSNNEISSQDMQALFTKVEELKDKYGCAFVFIHHETKSVIERRSKDFSVKSTDAGGAIDLQQTAEHFFNTVETASGNTLYHTKNNLGAKGPSHVVKVVDLLSDRSSIAVKAY